MDVPILWHPDAELHRNSPGHPERPERSDAARAAVQEALDRGSARLVTPREATREELERVHTSDYVDRIQESASRPRTSFDLDTSANEHTARVAALASGASVQAVEVVDGTTRPFVLMRPPGHHALDDVPMGFCIYNQAATAAAAARANGHERVAIIDWDVHHGNGTEYIFRDRSDVFYASIHQSPHYPGTGPAHYTGEREGEGFTLNCPLRARSGRDEYLLALRDRIVPALTVFAPSLVIVSAGMDVHRLDPLGGMRLTGEDLAEITTMLVSFAGNNCDGRIVHILEGGYDLDGLADGVAAIARTLAAA